MSSKLVTAVVILAALALAACQGGANQNGSTANSNAAGSSALTGGGAPAGGTGALSPAAARETVAAFPESRAVAVLNASRVFSEVLPRVMSAADLAKMYADAQREMGVDLRQVQYVGLGLRYREPVNERTPPDVIVIVKGSFDTGALVNSFAKQARGGRTQESYKGRTIEVLRKRPAPADGGSSAPAMPADPYDELAFVTLDPQTVVFGQSAYVKAAIDAADGQGRVNAQLADLVTRNPDNLLSFGGDVPASFADMARGSGMVPRDPDTERIFSSMRQVQAAVSMTQGGAADFKIEANIKTDTAETAAWMKGLIDSKLAEGRTAMEQQMQSAPPDRAQDREDMQMVLNTLSSISNTAVGNELQLSITISQATISKLMQRSGAGPTTP